MRNRSWMAARAVVACLAVAAIGPSRASDDDGGEVAPVANTVKLEIQISGLGPEGGKVEVKPAHPGCRFAKVEKLIAKGAHGDVVKIAPFAVAASTTNPDRDCSFEIVVTEPGRKPKTFRRGLQLTPSDAGAATPSRTLKCYLPATTLAAKDDPKSRPRR